MESLAAVVQRETLGEGRWLKLERLTYRDTRGVTRQWETAGRRSGQGAVCVIARLRPSDRYVLIEQYRPPIDTTVIEFAAGLIDAGETPAAAAVRELREETGYTGTVTWVGPEMQNSPGLTDEFSLLVSMEIDETAPCNAHPTPHGDESEDIRVHLVPRSDLPAFFTARAAAGARVEGKVLTHFHAIGAGPG